MIRKFLSSQQQSNDNQGFTLVEMLVAMAVFILLAVLLAQVMSLTSQATAATSKALDAAGQARLVFDRLASDLAARPQRPDLGMVFTSVNGGGSTAGANDTLQFYSQVDGYSGTRQVAAVSYSIMANATTGYYQLERGSTGTYYPNASGITTLSPQFLTMLTPPTAPLAPATTDYDVLSNEVFRLEFCFLLNTGSLSSTSNHSNNYTYSDVVGLVVAIGILDSQSFKLLTSTQLQTLSASLPDCSANGQDPISGWYTAIAKPGFASGIPPLAVQNVRVYQRTFYVQ